MIEVRFNAYRANEFLAALNTGRPLATNYPTWQPEDIFTLLGVLFTGISSGKWRDPERHNLAHPEVREHMDEIALAECVQAIEHLVDCMSMMMDNTYFDHYEVNHGLEISLDADGEPRFRPTFGVLNMPEGYLPPESPESENA